MTQPNHRIILPAAWIWYPVLFEFLYHLHTVLAHYNKGPTCLFEILTTSSQDEYILIFPTILFIFYSQSYWMLPLRTSVYQYQSHFSVLLLRNELTGCIGYCYLSCFPVPCILVSFQRARNPSILFNYCFYHVTLAIAYNFPSILSIEQWNVSLFDWGHHGRNTNHILE